MTRLSLPLLVVTLCACGPGPDLPDGGVDGGSSQLGELFIGTATSTSSNPKTLVYAPIADGAELELEPGAQGGFHVFLHLRVDDFAIENMGARPLVQRWARRVDTGELVSRAKRTHAFVPTEQNGLMELETAVPLFLCPTPVGIEVADQPLDLEVKISADEDSEGVQGTLRFTPRCPNDDQNQFCLNICFG